MGIVAGFLVQNSLKYLLQFGEVSDYLGYSAMTDFFPRMSMKANPDCDEFHCRDKQKKFKVSEAERLKREALEAKPEEVVDEVVHEENDWGISLADESTPSVPEPSAKSELVEGVRLAYDAQPKQSQPEEVEEDAPDQGPSLDELMQQMKSL